MWRELAQTGKTMARLAFDVMWLVPAAACCRLPLRSAISRRQDRTNGTKFLTVMES